MNKLLVCQHVPFEILGTLNPLLKSAGVRIKYVNFGRHPDAEPSLDGYQALVVLGGPMCVDDADRYPHLLTEVRLIQNAVERGLPVLGICLGAQLIAKALGAKVATHHTKEIGWYDVAPTTAGRGDPLLRHFRGRERIFQWHGDTFEVPRGAIHLAGSALCTHQAFRYGTNVYGFQFHLEVDEALIERWMRLAHYRQEVEALHGPDITDLIRRETPLYLQRSIHLSELVFGEFVELIGAKKKYRMLPSR